MLQEPGILNPKKTDRKVTGLNTKTECIIFFDWDLDRFNGYRCIQKNVKQYKYKKLKLYRSGRYVAGTQ